MVDSALHGPNLARSPRPVHRTMVRGVRRGAILQQYSLPVALNIKLVEMVIERTFDVLDRPPLRLISL